MDGASGSSCIGWPHQTFDRKRSREQMERGSRSHSLTSSSPPAWPPSSRRPSIEITSRPDPPTRLHLPPLQLPGNPPPPRRYPGDGFDFRRPANTTMPTAAVIDLTSDTEPSPETRRMPPPPATTRASRGPRFDRDIIDLSDDPPAAQHSTSRNMARSNPQPESPEIQFMGTRQLPAPRRRPEPEPMLDIVNLDIDMDDDFEVLGETTRNNGGRRGGNQGQRAYGTQAAVGGLARFLPQLFRETVGRVHPGGPGLIRPVAPRRFQQRPTFQNYTPGNFAVPQMDFNQVAFDLGGERDEAPDPTYEAPPPAPEGFTRSPRDDEMLVCPNCDDELCTGATDRKKQVWVIKGCGHVYCGECTYNRHKSKRKGKEPINAKVFKECQVEGCGKKCSAPSQMVQLFL